MADKTTKITEILIVEGDSDKPMIWFLKGLPASGKSTWALRRKTEVPKTVIISKDQFRPLFGTYDPDLEAVVRATTRAAGFQSLESGYNIIIDDTNLVLKYKNYWKDIAERHKFSMIEVFFDTELEECIRRDAEREYPRKVGAERITEMYRKYMFPYESRVIDYCKQDETLPKAIIVDIDGTVAMADGRNMYAADGMENDVPNMPVIGLVKRMSKDHKILFVTGRTNDPATVAATTSWLNEHIGPSYSLFMREDQDFRKDSIIKRELFEKHIQDNYYISFVLDDRDQVVDVWRNELHLPCFQVNYGNF